MADPFASAAGIRVLHPSLSTCNKLPIDLYEPLVSDFLQDDRYAKWAAGYRPWQLHCYGGPGCGKSTFAVCASQDLRRRYEGRDIFVAYICIKERVSDHQASFVEDFLFCLYNQVCSRPAYIYERACQTGQASSERLKQIRTALHQQLIENKHNFLIFDGYDTLDMPTCLLIDHELKNPGVSNLSLLVTRRNPLYRRPEHFNIGCDKCGRSRLNLYWECQICGHDGPQYCCECKENGVLCTNEEHKLALSEPYDRIDLEMNKSTRSAMLGFIARELETHSELGTQVPEQLAFDVSARVGGNVNLAKLRIDDLLKVNNPVDGQTPRDRLPRSVVAFFDNEIDRVLQSNPFDRDLGLMAIAAVAGSEDKGGYGMTAHDLEQSMRQERKSSAHYVRHSTRSLEDIIIAANGLLVLQPYEDDLYVVCFNQMFKLYVMEDYNEYLYLAKKNLCMRNMTSGPGDSDSWNIAPSTTSPPTMSKAFDNEDYMGVRSSSQDSAYYSRGSTLNTTQNSDSDQPYASETKGLSDRCGILPEPSAVLKDPSNRLEKSASSMTLCAFCQEQILKGDSSSGDHHMSSEGWRDSLISRCMICIDLYQQLLIRGTETSDGPSPAHQYCLYRWAIRSTGRSHNTESSLQLTFKPCPDSEESTKATFPTRRYYILSETDVHVCAEDKLSLSTDPNKPGSGLQIREWMKTCAETHSTCNAHQKSEFVPTRLVDLEIGDTDMVRIVSTAKENVTGPYLTLSHSWGPPTFLQLKKETKSRLMGPGVKITELTPNFQQAISVAKFIGIRYIWIDSLCIMQGPEGDFKSEGQLMHKVYRHSHCNIAIADSLDSEGGLFRQRNPADILPMRVESDGSGKLGRGTWRILRDDLWEKELLATKIYSRGWVFQERMLAPRILHFAASQIFWDCSTLSACEALPDGLPHALDANASTDRHWRGRMQQMSSNSLPDQQPLVGANDDSIETFWRSALLSYTSCNLTNQDDKSIAIWSIAKLVRDILGETYGGGLWETNLEEQLAWHARDYTFEGCSRIPELQHQYPSWSWASMKGPIIAHSRLAKARQYVVTNHGGDVIAFESHFEDKNKEPELKRVPIELSGYMVQGNISQILGPPSLNLNVYGVDQQESAGHFDVFLDEALPSASSSDVEPRPIIILAASAMSANGSRPTLPSHDSGSKNSTRSKTKTQDGATDSSPLTYSGIALLLTPLKAYKANQDAAFKALLREVVVRSPDRSWPDPPYGQGKSLVGRTTDLRMLVSTLSMSLRQVKAIGGREDTPHRRIGAVEFRGMPEEVWRAISKGGKSKIWLD